MIKRKNDINNTDEKIEDKVEEKAEVKESKAKKLSVDEEGFAINGEIKSVDFDSTDFAKDVDNERVNYLKISKISRLVSTGILIGTLVAVILLWTLLMKKNEALTLGLVITLIILVILYNYFGKKFLDRKALTYVSNYYEKVNKYIFNLDKISNVSIEPKGKLDQNIIKDARLYKNIERVSSRNLTFFDFNGDRVSGAEISIERRGEKRMETLFVGKSYEFQNNLDFPGRILISIKGKHEFCRSLTDIEGLDIVENSEKLLVLSNYDKTKQIVVKQAIDELKKLRVGNDLLDAFISIRSGKTVIGLDFSNEIMNLPIDQPFKQENVDFQKECIQVMLKVVELINKKETKDE